MWNGCKTHQIWHTLRVIWNRNVGNQKIWNREIVSCRAGKSDVVVVGNRGLGPLSQARPGGGPASRPMGSQHSVCGPMRARGGAERGEWSWRKGWWVKWAMIMGNAVQGNHDYDQIMDHHRHREDEFIKIILYFDNFRGERTLNSVWEAFCWSKEIL